MVFVCYEMLLCYCVVASNASVDATKAGVSATQPVVQLPTNAGRASCLSGTAGTTDLRLSVTA